MKTLLLHITGRVQGVFYRAETKREADLLGLTGWVKNNADGSVTCVAQGRTDKVNRLTDWCKNGSDASRVDSVESTVVDSDELFDTFEIRRS